MSMLPYTIHSQHFNRTPHSSATGGAKTWSDPQLIWATDEYAYIANYSPTYTSVCTVTPGSGELTDCVDAILGYGSRSVVVANDIAYVGDGPYICDVNSQDGTFSGCTSTGSGGGAGIAILQL